MSGVKFEPALNGLRALAALSVLTFHVDELLPGGSRGVDIFFVLSGYLVTSILLQGPTLGTFFARRARRLLPALILLLAVYLALRPFLLSGASTLNPGGEALFVLLYGYNWLCANHAAYTGLSHTWSLGVEGQFYLLWPLAVLLLQRARRPDLWLLAAWAILSIVRWRTPDPDFAFFATHLHGTGLILGAALAFRPFSPRFGYLALAALLVLMATTHTLDFRWSISLAEVATAALIPALQQPGRLQAVFAWPPVEWLGRISYGIYLWHWPLVMVIGNQASDLPAVLVLSIAFAAASYYLVERWFLTPSKGVRPSLEAGAHAS
jgi:peptidoglycan/LPS O-acetylase OafA/YrhL